MVLMPNVNLVTVNATHAISKVAYNAPVSELDLTVNAQLEPLKTIL